MATHSWVTETTHEWVTEVTHEWVTEVTHEWVAFAPYGRLIFSPRLGDAELRWKRVRYMIYIFLFLSRLDFKDALYYLLIRIFYVT